MNTAITPEVMGLETQIFEDSPMTESEEKELVIVKTAIKTAYADKLERDLAIGAGLLQIFRRKLYRCPSGGRNWEQWLADESAELTAGRALWQRNRSRLARLLSVSLRSVTPAARGRARPSPSNKSPIKSAPCWASLTRTPKPRWICGRRPASSRKRQGADL
jgi:hypothetical protein